MLNTGGRTSGGKYVGIVLSSEDMIRMACREGFPHPETSPEEREINGVVAVALD